jgi:CRISPR-associated protein Cmr4
MDKILVKIETITPLHVGAGAGRGEVDLPIDRDGFGLPYIPASGLKGALRDEPEFDEKERKELFGSPPQEGEKGQSGKLLIHDAYLLATPARSLRGVWVLVTSPLLLKRFKMLAELAGSDIQRKFELLPQLEIDSDRILVSEEGKRRLEIDGKIVLNEDFELRAVVNQKVSEIGSVFLPPEENWRFGLVSDDLIVEIVNTSLMRRARVALKDTAKVVDQGPWEEEDVPPHSLFAGLFLLYQEIGKNLREKLEKKVGEGYLVLGGHETIGRGLVKLQKW